MKYNGLIRRFVAVLLALSLLFLQFMTAGAENEPMIVTASKLTVYSSSAMTKSIGTVSKNTIVTMIAQNGGIAKVKFSGKTGYAALSDLKPIAEVSQPAYINAKTYVYSKPSSSAKKVSVSKNLAVNLIAVSGSWATLERNGTIGYAYAKYVSKGTPVSPTPTPANDLIYEEYLATVTASSLSVYVSPSTKATKLGTLKKNAQVTVHAYNDSWAYISLNGNYGYCSKTYLKRAETAAPELGGLKEGVSADFSASVKTSSLKVYQKASTSSSCLGTIKKGTIVEVIAYNKTWAYVELNGKYGYCKHASLTKIVTPTSTPTLAPSPTPSPTPTPTPTPTPSNKPSSNDPIFTNSSTSNEEKLYLYFTEEAGYSSAVACGILANIRAESNFNPQSGSSYKGLCQWSATRYAGLVSWCENQGLDPESLEGQAKYLAYDLKNRYTVYHKALIAFENSAQGAYEAGYYFCYYYERPSNKESKSVSRGNNAKDIYWEKYNP